VNRAVCPAAPRVREAQNLRISLLNSLLAGNTARERFARDCPHRQQLKRWVNLGWPHNSESTTATGPTLFIEYSDIAQL
jgi:hypothetical protein